jgi:hypothetical protein
MWEIHNHLMFCLSLPLSLYCLSLSLSSQSLHRHFAQNVSPLNDTVRSRTFPDLPCKYIQHHTIRTGWSNQLSLKCNKHHLQGIVADLCFLVSPTRSRFVLSCVPVLLVKVGRLHPIRIHVQLFVVALMKEYAWRRPKLPIIGSCGCRQ